MIKIDQESFTRYFCENNVLPVILFDEFCEFLDDNNIEHREGKGATQVMQVKANENIGFKVIFRSKHDIKNYTYNEALRPVMEQFFKTQHFKSIDVI